MNRKVLRILLIGLTFIWIGIIFYFSNQTGTKSSLVSRDITRYILKLFHPNYMQLSKKEQSALLKSVGLIIRKLAHFAEYGLLSFFLYFVISICTKREKLINALVILIGVLFAFLDELHQYFITGRAFMLQDILIDFIGIFSMLLLIFSLRRLIDKKKR